MCDSITAFFQVRFICNIKVKMAAYWMTLLGSLLVQAVICNEENTIDNIPPIYEPTWTYKCTPGIGCSRREHPLPTATSIKHSAVFTSVDVCRTACGQFGGIWPKPLGATLTMETVKIHPRNIMYNLSNVPTEVRELITEMASLTSKNIRSECGGNVTESSATHVNVFVNVRSGSTALDWDTSEEYALDLNTTDHIVTVNIVAETVYGARHGLETLTNLISADRPYFSNENKCGLRMLASAKIRDQPAYKYRGFLLDTSRNFIPMAAIKRMIDGMATVKLNVFHWHVTDSHSFPLESVRVPQFTRYGAYSAKEIYSVEEIRGLIKHARIRGVRVVIEIDAPAHAGNGWQWGKEYGLGDLAVCVNEEPWRQLCIQPPCGQLNPANPEMYRALRSLYRDVAELLPSPALLHMGGDEVFIGCWNSSKEIRSYMKDKGFDLSTEGFIRLWAEFHAKALQSWDEELVEAGGQKQPVMLWSSELTQANRIQKYLDKSRYVIEVWEPQLSLLLSQLVNLGYRVVSVPKDIWYLDHGFWGKTKYSNWRQMYGYILPRNKEVLGGEVAMWSEYVDSQALETRVWPRAAAVAERLWSDPTTWPLEVESRMQRLRVRLEARGLRVDAISPGWCAQNDGKCL